MNDAFCHRHLTVKFGSFIVWALADRYLCSLDFDQIGFGRIGIDKIWRRGQVAKAADCKSAIAGSTPADASDFKGASELSGAPFFLG